MKLRSKLLAGCLVATMLASIGSLSTSVVLGASGGPPWINTENEDKPTKPYTIPALPSQTQSLVVPGFVDTNSSPGAYLFQRDDGNWTVDSYRDMNSASIPTIGTWANPYPATWEIYNKIDTRLDAYRPKEGFFVGMPDGTETFVNPKRMTNLAIVEAKPDDDKGMFSELVWVTFKKPHVILESKIGGIPDQGGFLPSKDLYQFSPPVKLPITTAPNAWKHNIGYVTPVKFKWRGDYIEKKLIKVEGQASMGVNTTQKLKANIYSAAPQADGSGGIKHTYGTASDVADRTSETTWKLESGQGIIELTAGGNVKALKKGTAVVSASWYKDLWKLTRTFTISVGGAPVEENKDPVGKCAEPRKSSSSKSPASAMEASATGKVKADQRGSEKFDVSKGIPVTESLFANVLSKTYLFDYDFGKYDGECNYEIQITKTYNLSWQMYEQTGTSPCTPQKNGSCTGGGPIMSWVPYSDSSTVKNEYKVKREYSYWALDKYDTYKISRATATNYALPGGSIGLTPEGYTPPTSDSSKLSSWQQHIQEPTFSNKTLPSQTLTGRGSKPTVPSENWQTHAEGQVKQVKVKNDRLVFDGKTVMEDSWKEKTTSSPGSISSSGKIGENVLYKPNQKISKDKLNGKDYATTGNIVYDVLDSVDSPSSKTFVIQGYNPVTIHTPVVNYSSIPETNRPFDQSVAPDRTRIPLVLGREFVLNFPNNGQHVNYLGYGNKDYTKYVGQKRIQFPFDVYAEGAFYSANSWIPLSVSGTQTKFKLPEWINEGNYTVRTESWAVNSPSTNTSLTSHNLNSSLNDYAAYEEFNVEVIGRVYGFRVHDIGDLRFESLFRTAIGSTQWSGFQYFSGGKDKDGLPNSVSGKATRMLPVRPGSHPTQAATTPHNGYPFLFYFNTIGNVWNVGEGVKIVPEFYYVPKKGGIDPVPVDLYYNTSKTKLVKVGSDEDKKTFSRVVKLGDPMRNVDATFLKQMATFEYNNFWTSEAKSKTSLSKFLTQVPNRKTTVGTGYKDMTLGYQMRTLVGNVDTNISVPQDTQKRATQRWFGEYNLPIAPYILPKGTDLEKLVRTKYKGKIDGNEREFLKNGYIIVNFKISTYRNGKPNTEILAYDASKGGAANMWKIEGQVQSSTSYLGAEFDYSYGDIVMFESDFSVKDDFSSTGR